LAHIEDNPKPTSQRIEKVIQLFRSSNILKNHFTDVTPYLTSKLRF